MPIKSELIEQYLSQGLELKFQTKENENIKQYIVQYGLNDDEVGDFSIAIVVNLQECGDEGYEFVEFRVIGFDGGDKEKVKNSEYLPQLTDYMLASNYQYKIGSWSYEPKEGECYFSCIHAIEDNEQMTGKQFVRLFETMLKISSRSYVEFQRILTHGDSEAPLLGLKENLDDNRKQVNELLEQLLPYAEGLAEDEPHVDLYHLALGSLQASDNELLSDIPMLHLHLSEHKPQLERFADMKAIDLASAKTNEVSKQHSSELVSKINDAIKSDDPVMYLINAALTDVVQYVQREQTAYHEAGHAVVSLVLRPEWRLKEISIIEQEGSNGRVGMDINNPIVHTPTTLEYVREDICVRLAGQLSQVKKFGTDAADTGAMSDFQSATKTAYTAVAVAGLDDEFGPVSLPQVAELNGGMSVQSSGYLFDLAQVRTQAILKESRQRTDNLVGEYWPVIEQVAKLLIEQGSISESDIQNVFQACAA